MREYVRPGKLRLEFRGLAFVGSDSATALRTALAAGRQNRLWNVVDLLYRNQGTENTGWVTESLLRSVGEATPGLDVGRMLSERGSSAVAGAGRHLKHTLLADRAKVFEGLFTDSEQFALHLIGVGNEIANEEGRATRDVGQAMADEAAGAGFGDGKL